MTVWLKIRDTVAKSPCICGCGAGIYTEDLSHREKTVYIYLRDRADASGVCWPGIKTIAGELGLSPRTVQRALADLEHRQLIEKRQRHRANGSLTSNLYRLTAAKKSQSPAKGGL